MDIDYMDKFKIFTRDPINFSLEEMNSFINYINSINVKLVLIVDPTVKVEIGYDMFDDGMKKDVFIKQNDGKTPIVNSAWYFYLNLFKFI
jgi:alpha-glucosidase